MAVRPPPIKRRMPPIWRIIIPSLFFFHKFLLKKKKDKFMSIKIIVRRPPGIGRYQIQKNQEEKYFSWAANKPISFWARVPNTTKIIIHIMINTNNFGVFNILVAELIINIKSKN